MATTNSPAPSELTIYLRNKNIPEEVIDAYAARLETLAEHLASIDARFIGLSPAIRSVVSLLFMSGVLNSLTEMEDKINALKNSQEPVASANLTDFGL